MPEAQRVAIIDLCYRLDSLVSVRELGDAVGSTRVQRARAAFASRGRRVRRVGYVLTEGSEEPKLTGASAWPTTWS